MDLQAFQRMMQIFPGVNDPSNGTGMGPGMQSIGGDMMPPANVQNDSLDTYQPRTAISDQLTSHLANMPIRPEASNLRKIGASIAGFGAGGGAQAVVGGQPIGYSYNPDKAKKASDEVEFGNFDNQLNDWQNQIKALGIGANEEDRANAGEVKRLAGNAKNDIDQQKTWFLLHQISKAFKAQQLQAELIVKHKKSCKYPILICGDMNNSAYSYVYRSIRGTLNDSFEEAGSKFGETYNFKFYPARIDYIFSDSKIKIKRFTSFSDFKNSDHFPIMTRLEME